MEQIAINILPKGAKPVCHSSQFDEGRQIMFNLFNDDAPYTLSGTETISVLVRKPDGTEVLDNVTNTSDSYVVWEVSTDACELSGVCECELSIVENGILLGSKNFTMKVEEDAYGGRNIEVRTASGRIATFSTNMVEAFKSLKSDINPVQDLNGYSKPWSGGGGKNKLNATGTNEYTTLVDGVYTVTSLPQTGISWYIGWVDLKAGTYIFNGGLNFYCRCFLKAGDEYYTSQGEDVPFTLTSDTTVSVSGVITPEATVGYKLKPMIRLASVSDATFEPYENICPISGFSALNVTRTGKNILPKLYEQTTKNGVTLTANTDGTLSFSGVATSICYFIKSFNLKKGSYIFSSGVDESFTTFDTYISKDGTVIARGGNLSTNSFTLTEDSSVNITVRVEQNVNTDGLKIYPMIRLSSDSDTTYEPYNGQTATVNFGQTVYGGKVDLTNGKLKITHRIINLWDFNYSYNTVDATHHFTSTSAISDSKNPSSHGTIANILCSQYDNSKSWISAFGSTGNNGYIALTPSGLFGISDDRYTSPSDFKTALQTENAKLVYELATPIEITTTPENLTAISGENNVYADTNGDTTVEYYIEV